MAVQDAESGETGGGDLHGGFDGRPDGWGDEVPCANQVNFGMESREGRTVKESEGGKEERKRERVKEQEAKVRAEGKQRMSVKGQTYR